MNSFKELEQFYHSRRIKSKDYRPTGLKATTVVQTDIGYGIKYHNTIVVEYHYNGDILLSTGNYFSRTTKDRMNRYTPYHINISQKNWQWFINGAIYGNVNNYKHLIKR